MKISIDFDGTLWEHQEFFKSFQKAMKQQGHEVGVLTAHSLQIQKPDYDLMLARGFILPDFGLYIENMNDEEKNMTDSDREVVVGHYKARMIVENNINIHFDDNADYINQWLKEWNKGVPQHIVFTSPTNVRINS